MSTDQTVGTPEMLKDFDALAEKTLQDFACAGAAVAVIKDGAVILSKGYGYRNFETKEPVDSDTLFAIGSASKAFTAFGLGMLADENKIDWDQPVRRYMPAFALSETYASEQTTPRDLLSHRTGLPGHELAWYNSLLTRADLLKRLPHLGLHHPFRSQFQYANLMFLAAGCLIEEVAQATWEEYTRERIFKPLGMRRSNFSVKDSMKDPNAALPYLTENNQPKLVPFRDLDAMGPAGSINSCLNDMVKWVSLHLEGGKVNQSQLISERNLEQILTPVIPTPRSFNAEYFNYPGLGVMTYGLGWFINDYRGHRLVNHGGSIDGFLACISFMPEEGLGVICLTNQGNSLVPYLLAYSLYDRLLGLPPFDWGERMMAVKKRYEAQTGADAAQKQSAAGEAAPQPTRSPEAYAGEYENPGYGVIKVEVEEGALKAHYNLWVSALLPHGFDAFILKDLSS
ncbi:MAG: serine hydrolase, partial [Anaerolineaceae bacterium]